MGGGGRMQVNLAFFLMSLHSQLWMSLLTTWLWGGLGPVTRHPRMLVHTGPQPQGSTSTC